MTKARFTDEKTIELIAQDDERFTLGTYFPIRKEEQIFFLENLTKYFDKNFSNDKSSMVYWALMDMMTNTGRSFYSMGSDRSEERIRIGARIKELRQHKGMDAKHLALLTKIDASNLSRIEQGKYSVGFDILNKIANALGTKVDIVEHE